MPPPIPGETAAVPLPIFASIRELGPAPRSFLLFTTLNVVSWHSLVGPSMVLFARKIDMPAVWVGVLLSFMPLSMLLVMFTVPLVVRHGPKRLMISTWSVRNLVAAAVFFLPWVLHSAGPEAAWYLLGASILGFCIVRAIGAGAWFPWLHEFLPEGQRGAYFSAETAVAQIIIVGVNLFHAVLLSGSPGVNHFLFIYATGIAAGLLSIVLMGRVPGGERVAPGQLENPHATGYRAVLRDRGFLLFVGMVSVGFASVTFLASAAVLYMRDRIGLSPNFIMAVMTTGSLSVFLTIRYWARFADHSGQRSAIALTLGGHGVIALVFFLLDPGSSWTPWLLFPAVGMGAVLSAAFNTISHRAMLDHVPDHDRVSYTNVWILGTSLALGLTPILAGALIQFAGPHGYHACFLAAGLGGVACALGERLLSARSTSAPRPLAALFSPAQPVRTLARIAWITSGFHPSNRDSRGN